MLDPFEKQFDLSSIVVDFGDLLGLQMVSVGDKPILDAGLRVGVSDQAQRLLNPFEPDGLIVGDPSAPSHGPFEQVLDIGIFDRLSQSFHKDIVPPGTSAAHAEFASAGMNQPDKLFSGELAPLIRLTISGGAVADRKINHCMIEV